MLKYIGKRIIGVIPTLIIVVTFVFFFVRLIPGDPARLVAGPQATLEDAIPFLLTFRIYIFTRRNISDTGSKYCLLYTSYAQSQYKQFLFSHPHIHNRSCNKPFPLDYY